MGILIKRGLTIPISRLHGLTTSGIPWYAEASFSVDGQYVLIRQDNDTQAWSLATGQLADAGTSASPINHAAHLSMENVGRDVHGRGYRFYEEETGVEVGFVKEPFPDCIASAPDGRSVAIGYQDGRLRIEELPVTSPLFLYGHSTSMNNHMHQNCIWHLEFDSSSRFLISMAEEDNRPKLWDLRSPRNTKTWNGEPAHYLDNPTDIQTATDGWINSFNTRIRFSPAEPTFVCIHQNPGRAQVWHIQEEEAIASNQSRNYFRRAWRRLRRSSVSTSEDKK